MLADNFRFYFEIVPKGHHNCQLSILNCQFTKDCFTPSTSNKKIRCSSSRNCTGFFYTSLYMAAASSLRTFSATRSTSTATVRAPMEISILSPTFTSQLAFTTRPLTLMRPLSQASLATVRRLMRRETFRNLSSRMAYFATASFRALLALKPGTRVAGISMASLVWGLRPMRASRSLVSKEPKPEI